MKLVKVEQQFDGPRLVFFFTADTRVDFRGLVRELAAEFRCRRDAVQIHVTAGEVVDKRGTLFPATLEVESVLAGARIAVNARRTRTDPVTALRAE